MFRVGPPDSAQAKSSADDEDESDIERVQFKVILLGDGAVGKTSIAMRFAEDQFSQTYKQTVGVDFHIRRLNIPPKFQAALQLWDIGGQSIGSKMVGNYVAGAHAVLLCYDITNYDSFANLEDWYRIVATTFKSSSMPYIALVANKCDMRHLTAVKNALHTKFADENNMASFFMSARSGDQVHHAFEIIAATLCGVPLVKGISPSSEVVTAVIINSDRHDPNVNNGEIPEYTASHKGGYCTLS